MKPSLHRAIGRLPGLHVKEVEGDPADVGTARGGGLKDLKGDDYQGFCIFLYVFVAFSCFLMLIMII